MAPSNGTTFTPPNWSSPAPPPTIAHYNGTLQWHQSIPPKLKLVVTLPPNHSTLQWYPTMAPSNGTTSTAPCNGTLAPRPIRRSGSSPSPLLEVRTPIAIAIWGKIVFLIYPNHIGNKGSMCFFDVSKSGFHGCSCNRGFGVRILKVDAGRWNCLMARLGRWQVGVGQMAWKSARLYIARTWWTWRISKW